MPRLDRGGEADLSPELNHASDLFWKGGTDSSFGELGVSGRSTPAPPEEMVTPEKYWAASSDGVRGSTTTWVVFWTYDEGPSDWMNWDFDPTS